MTWTFDGSVPTFDHGAGFTFDGAGGGSTATGSGAAIETGDTSSGTGSGSTAGSGAGAITEGGDSAAGVGLAGPVITLNPSGEVVTTGNTAAFTAAASGTPTPTVQWQTDSGTGGATWSNISGATSTTYVTGPLTIANTGWQYRAIFTNSQGSATTSAATVTVVSIIYSGGKNMQFVFGPGNMVVTPLTDAYGNAIANPTPRRLGAFQEASFDTSSENKMLYGPNQFPLAVGRGKAKVGLKVKAAQFSIDQWNALYIGQPVNQVVGVLAAYIDNVGTTLTTTTVTPATTYAAYLTGTSPAFDYDLGVQDGAGNAFKQVAASPGSYQYSLSGGVYTFNATDVSNGVKVFISFAYTATAATGAKNAYVNINNLPMGQAPFLQVDLFCTYGGNPLLVTLFQAIASKLSFATKLDDFAIPDLEFDGFANSQNIAYRIAAGQ
jgi:hypothetical protein